LSLHILTALRSKVITLSGGRHHPGLLPGGSPRSFKIGSNVPSSCHADGVDKAPEDIRFLKRKKHTVSHFDLAEPTSSMSVSGMAQLGDALQTERPDTPFSVCIA